MQRQLEIIAGPEKGRSFRIQDGQTIVIGRGPESDTQLNDRYVSRSHCRVQIVGPKAVLSDTGSSGGTFVAGKKIVQRELELGDAFQVGKTVIRYQVETKTNAETSGDERKPNRGSHYQSRQTQIYRADAARGLLAMMDEPPPLHELVGQSLHDYRLDKIITGTESGMVFKAYDTKQKRVAAVKVLTPDFTNSEEQKERFVRGMKTMLPIRHPNIIRLYNAGKKGPYCYAVMEFIDGESLAQVIDRIGFAGMLDWREVWRVAVHIGRGLAEAYDRKILHRNVTPTNILRRSEDKVCLLGDLMLAKALEGAQSVQVTQAGQVVGDVPYMSPERTLGGTDVDCRSDIYGLGATMYALLTGRPPFENNSLPELSEMVRKAAPVKPREFQPAVDEMFQDRIVLRMLAKDPGDRHQTPAELLRDLEQIGNSHNLDADTTSGEGRKVEGGAGHESRPPQIPKAKKKPSGLAALMDEPPPLHELVGQSLHDYRLDKIITGTESGMVFKAYDTKQKRTAAVKVLTPDFANSEEQKERFVRGMKTMMPIRHPNIVRLYNAGKKGPYCYAVMEFIEGESLAQVIDRIGFAGMLDWREVWRVAVHIGRGLTEAYERKIIHRNVTPTNILRRSQDKSCLLGDLMLAKALEGAQSTRVTQAGQVVGDVSYMSPERTQGSTDVDCRSDIYGLGATMYALLTGRPPFESNSLLELTQMVRKAEPVKPRDFQPSVDEMFQDRVVMRMLAKDPKDRHQTPAELLRDLVQIGKFNNLDADSTSGDERGSQPSRPPQTPKAKKSGGLSALMNEPPPLSELVGQSLRVFRLDKIIAGTESGMVFQAYDTERNRKAAVKVLTPDLTDSEEQKARFVRAMKTMLPIRHPNIVRLYNAGTKGPYCFAVMEYIEGENLAQVIDRIGREGMLPWREVRRIAVHIGRGLAEAHERKIIHRNVTPTNILRRSADSVHLLGDLMLAKALQGTQSTRVTQAGQVVGDVAYMSPERTQGGDNVDCRSDIYGLGATLYALLTGKPPFESNSLPELTDMVRRAEPVKPSEYQPSINQMFQDRVVMKMLAKDPSDRHQTPTELLLDLNRIS